MILIHNNWWTKRRRRRRREKKKKKQEPFQNSLLDDRLVVVLHWQVVSIWAFPVVRLLYDFSLYNDYRWISWFSHRNVCRISPRIFRWEQVLENSVRLRIMFNGPLSLWVSSVIKLASWLCHGSWGDVDSSWCIQFKCTIEKHGVGVIWDTCIMVFVIIFRIEFSISSCEMETKIRVICLETSPAYRVPHHRLSSPHWV